MRMIRNRILKKSTGYVLTPQRKLILQTIGKSCAPIDAKELYQLVTKKDNSISLATIYRSLSLFKEKGLINEHRLGKTGCCYEITKSMEHQHMLCKCCGKVIDFDSPLIIELINKLQKEKQFNIEKVELCIQGTCFDCRENNIESN